MNVFMIVKILQEDNDHEFHQQLMYTTPHIHGASIQLPLLLRNNAGSTYRLAVERQQTGAYWRIYA